MQKVQEVSTREETPSSFTLSNKGFFQIFLSRYAVNSKERKTKSNQEQNEAKMRFQQPIESLKLGYYQILETNLCRQRRSIAT